MNSTTFDDTAQNALSNCVREIEKTTDAELVLVVRARAGSYRQADFLFGAILAFVGLLVLLFSPINFHEYWVVIDVVLLFVLGTLIASRSNILRRLLTSKRFRAASARACAAAMFYETGIANTNAEMGVLVHLSLLERRLELIADRGILKAVPPLEWNQIMFELHESGRQPDPATLMKALRDLGALLAKYLPAREENPNELPDAPRFELK